LARQACSPDDANDDGVSSNRSLQDHRIAVALQASAAASNAALDAARLGLSSIDIVQPDSVNPTMAPPDNNSSRGAVFGQAMAKKQQDRRRGGGGGAGRSTYQRQMGKGHSQSTSSSPSAATLAALQQQQQRARRLEATRQAEAAFGLDRVVVVMAAPEQDTTRRGWLYNLVPTTVRLRTMKQQYA
jgi:hypothetical protein